MLDIYDYHSTLFELVGITPDNQNMIREKYRSYLYKFDKCFNHPAQQEHFAMYETGLMSSLERKTVVPIARLLGDKETDPRLLQRFISNSPWDERLMWDIYKIELSSLVSDPDGMLTIDGCDFPKKGTESVGVARQHCGATGKVDNCQATVMMGYSGKRGYGLIDCKLYLPHIWHTDEYQNKWEKCQIPDEIEFQTKNQIAVDFLTSIQKSGEFKAKWVGADSAFGHDTKFIDSIPEEFYYFITVHSTDRFFTRMPVDMTHELNGRGKNSKKIKWSELPLKVKQIVEESDAPWKKVVLGLGAKGPIASEEKILRVVDIRNGEPNKEIWVYARRFEDGKIKYAISNAPEDTPLVKFHDLALRRWPIEQCFEECKTGLGMDHFEGRSWVGFHRHILLVFVAHLFLLMVRNTFSASTDQLSEIGQTIAKTFNQKSKSKNRLLSLYSTRDIVSAFLSSKIDIIIDTIRNVKYTVQDNTQAFLSRFKKFCKKHWEWWSRTQKKVIEKFQLMG